MKLVVIFITGFSHPGVDLSDLPLGVRLVLGGLLLLLVVLNLPKIVVFLLGGVTHLDLVQLTLSYGLLLHTVN